MKRISGEACAAAIPAVIIVGGALYTWAGLGFSWAYLLTAAISGTLAGLLAAWLYLRREEAVCAWLGLGIFLVFGYLKFFWITVDPSTAALFFPASTLPAFSSQQILLSAFILQSAAFAAYCIAVPLFFISGSLLFKGAAKAQKITDTAPASLPAILLAVIPLLSVAAMWVVGKNNIGVLGMPSIPLPFHLAGVVFYAQTIFIPALFLLQISAASRSGGQGYARAGILMFFAWGASDMLLRNSRASLFLVPLLLLFLAITGGLRVKRGEIIFGLIMLGSAFLLAPGATQYRYMRMGGASPLAALKLATGTYASGARAMLGSLGFIFFRIPGAETTILVLGLAAVPLWGGAFREMFTGAGLAGYLSQSLLGIPAESHNAIASSFVAGAYLAGGYYGVVLSSLLAAAFSVLGWMTIGTFAKKTSHVAKAIFLLLFFWGMTEGFSPMLLKQALVSAVSVAIFEFSLRGFARSGRGEGK